MSTIGERVREAREAKGLSQEALAAVAGVSQTTIDKIERGITKRSRMLHYIAVPLGLNVQELDPEMYGSPPPSSAKGLIAGGVDLNELHPSNVIAVYASDQVTPSEGDSLDGPPPLVEVGKTVLDYIPKPHFLNGSPEAYAIYISDSLMSPEFGPGDIVFVDPRLPFVEGTTLIFITNVSQYRIIGRLISHTPTEWEIMQWQRGHTLKIKRSDWPRVHRIVAKFYRR